MKQLKMILFLPLFISLSCAQQNKLAGKWQEYKTQWADSIYIKENPIGCSEFKYDFRVNGKLEDVSAGESYGRSYNYTIKSGKIFVNDNPRYTIEAIGKDSLILLDILPEDNRDLIKRHYFLKVDEFKWDSNK